MENEAFVDGELDSLMGMFNFDQCSSDDSNFYNAPNEIENDVFSSDDFFPFGKILQRNYPAVVDGSNHQTNLYVDSRQELMKPRKKQKLGLESNLVTEPPKTSWRDGQSLSSFNSSYDEKPLGLAANTSKSIKGKAKSNKGKASDPQSLYARKRRERINDRLKILQSLVPNGTKVDMSTMLEEAVHYVKFLQLQIKLLSSDDLWMYAPLAHNGLNMGLHHNLLSLGLCKTLSLE